LQLGVPHFPLEDAIQADEVSGVREFGSDEPLSVESLVTKQLTKNARRIDLTLEHLQLGARVIVSGEGAVIANLFEEFGVSNSDGQFGPEAFDFDLENYLVDADAIRTKCSDVRRFMRRNAKNEAARNAQIVAFCGDNFFDRLIEHPSVRGVYDGTSAAIERLGGNYSNSAFEFAEIMFVNYSGTDDNSTVANADDEARFFLSGVPGLFKQYNAPAAFVETVNTPGLPRYAKIAKDGRFNQSVEIHAQINPLPICLRPKTLVRGTVSESV
jgi:hypothetical protein